MYQAQHLDSSETSKDIVVKKEKFCKPQVNEVRSKYDLLKSFSQARSSVNQS